MCGLGPMSEHALRLRREQRFRRWFLLMCYLAAGAGLALILWFAHQHPVLLANKGLNDWRLAIIATAAVGTALMVFHRIRSWMFWETIFTVTLFLGVWLACLLFLPLAWALVLAAGLTLAHLFIRATLLHDIFYLLGAMGVAISFASWLSPEVLLVVLVGFTVYDMVAGPPGGPIQELAQALVKRGIIPGLLVVSRWKDLISTVDTAIKGPNALLGAGDLILPLCLVARAAMSGPYQAAIVLVGLLVGVLVLSRAALLHPRAALPALAVGACAPFVVLRILSLI